VKKIDLASYTTEGLHELFKGYFALKAGAAVASTAAGRALQEEPSRGAINNATAAPAPAGAEAQTPLLHEARGSKPQQPLGGAAVEPTAAGGLASVQLSAAAAAPLVATAAPSLEVGTAGFANIFRVAALLAILALAALLYRRRRQRNFAKPAAPAEGDPEAGACHVA